MLFKQVQGKPMQVQDTHDRPFKQRELVELREVLEPSRKHSMFKFGRVAHMKGTPCFLTT